MAVGIGQLNVISADTGPDSPINNQIFFRVQRVELDFGRSILIAFQSNPYNRLELQYDNLVTVVLNTALNILIIGK